MFSSLWKNEAIMKCFAILLLFLGICSSAVAQEEQEKPKPSFRDRIFFGGSFGLSFGDVTFVELSPVAGYKISERFSAGGGIIYQYLKDKRADFSSNTYGGRAFGIAKIFDPVFAQVEYEYLNYEYLPLADGPKRADFSSILAGGGVSQPLSGNIFLNMTALYNFTYGLSNAEYKPYDSPWVIRVSITAGF